MEENGLAFAFVPFQSIIIGKNASHGVEGLGQGQVVTTYSYSCFSKQDSLYIYTLCTLDACVASYM